MGDTGKRDVYFDVLKAIAIIMVVLGHVITILMTPDAIPYQIRNLIVGVNMPVFFAISGYFVWATVESGNVQKLMRHLRSYFQPAVFFALITIAVELCTGGLCASSFAIRVVRGVFVDPWFITTLAECYLISFFAGALARKVKSSVWIALIVIWILCACRPSNFPGRIHFNCIVSMLPHFVFGGLILRKIRLWENPFYGILCFGVFLVVAMFEGRVDRNGMSFYNADSTLCAFRGVRSAFTFVFRPILGMIGTVGLMAFVKGVLKALPRMRILAEIGTMTLGIYLFHGIPLRFIKSLDMSIDNGWKVLFATFALLALSYGIIWVLTRKTGRFGVYIWGK